MAETDKTRNTGQLRRVFVNDEGDPTPRATNSTHTVVFKYKDNSETRFDLRQIGVDCSKPSVARAAAAFGVSTSAGNAANTAAANASKQGEFEEDSTEHIEFLREEVEDRLADFLGKDGKPGIWSAERVAGAPRTCILLEAAIAYRTTVQKAEADATWLARTRERLQDKDHVKKLQSNAEFRAILDNLKLEKQKANAAKSAAAAKGDTGSAAALLD
jgi:hypothetical protein